MRVDALPHDGRERRRRAGLVHEQGARARVARGPSDLVRERRGRRDHSHRTRPPDRRGAEVAVRGRGVRNRRRDPGRARRHADDRALRALPRDRQGRGHVPPRRAGEHGLREVRPRGRRGLAGGAGLQPPDRADPLGLYGVEGHQLTGHAEEDRGRISLRKQEALRRSRSRVHARTSPSLEKVQHRLAGRPGGTRLHRRPPVRRQDRLRPQPHPLLVRVRSASIPSTWRSSP